jgi:hypothetical protein
MSVASEVPRQDPRVHEGLRWNSRHGSTSKSLGMFRWIYGCMSLCCMILVIQLSSYFFHIKYATAYNFKVTGSQLQLAMTIIGRDEMM